MDIYDKRSRRTMTVIIPETLMLIAQFAPTTKSLHNMQSAHKYFHLTPVCQYMSRVRFRTLHVIAKYGIYEYVSAVGYNDGLRLSFYPDGRCHESTYYVDNSRHGVSVLWNQSGDILSYSIYVEGIYSGDVIVSPGDKN